MMGALIAWLTGSRFALAVGKWAAITLAISLLLLSLRRSGDHAGRLAERLENTEKANAECWKPRLVALATVMILLSACATVSSKPVVGICLPVVEYSAAEQERVASEVEALPEDAALINWLADYSVFREQARSCVFQ